MRCFFCLFVVLRSRRCEGAMTLLLDFIPTLLSTPASPVSPPLPPSPPCLRFRLRCHLKRPPSLLFPITTITTNHHYSPSSSSSSSSERRVPARQPHHRASDPDRARVLRWRRPGAVHPGARTVPRGHCAAFHAAARRRAGLLVLSAADPPGY